MPTPQRGSGFIGLDMYLEANRAKAGAMADELASSVASKGALAEKELADVQRLFAEGLQAGQLGFDEKDLTAEEARRRAGITYSGPTGLGEVKGYSEARQKAEEAERQAQGLTSLYGRQAALQEKYGQGGGYTAGQQRFDAALSGAAGGQRFDELKSKYGSLSSAFDTAAKTAQGEAQGAIKSTQEAAGKYEALAPTLQQREKQRADEERQRKLEQDRQRYEEQRRRQVEGRRPPPRAGERSYIP